jgi:hypothetical protein
VKIIDKKTWPPGGWRFVEPTTGWEHPYPNTHNFNESAQALRTMRLNNKFRFSEASATLDRCKEDVEKFNCYRLIREGQSRLVMLENDDERLLISQGFQIVKAASAPEPKAVKGCKGCGVKVKRK